MSRFNVSMLGVPSARFASAAALEDFRDQAEQYEKAVADYAATGDAASLWEALTALGFNNGEIQAHVDKPGYRMSQVYATAADL